MAISILLAQIISVDFKFFNMTALRGEREVLTDFLKLYKELRCLWDVECEQYKERARRNQAWEILASKLKEMEPRATIMTARKKVDCMRTAYKREAKRVQMSKRMCTGTNGIYTPSLWYFNLLNFIDKKEEQCSSGVDTLISDEESQENEAKEEQTYGTRRTRLERLRESKRLKLYDIARDLLQHDDKKHNPFGIYVGEQLEQIATMQRPVAEKLISEIIFLAKTRKLSFDSKIETPSKSGETFSMHSNDSRSPTPHYL